MATTNNRNKLVYSGPINGEDMGGVMRANIQAGYEENLTSAPDGLEFPLRDRAIEFVRGTVDTQDWSLAYAVLTGTLGTYVFYEKESGTSPVTYTKHTITNPVVHRIMLRIRKGEFAGLSFDFECKAADETKGYLDMHVALGGQTAPSYIGAARGGQRVITAVHGSTSIFHVQNFDFQISLRLDKACNDSDVGYTTVETVTDGMTAGGSLTFEDASITATKEKCQALVSSDPSTLVLTVRQSQGATSKTVTILGVDFGSYSTASSSKPGFNARTCDFEITNDTTTQITLSGANKVLVIADVA